MKIFSLIPLSFLFVFLLLVACAPNSSDHQGSDKGLAVGLYNLSQSESFDSKTNKTITSFRFFLQNQESFPLDCNVLLVMKNSTDSSKKLGHLGVVLPGESKPAAFFVEMLSGDSSVGFKPLCVRASS